jgi:hypothetical protein
VSAETKQAALPWWMSVRVYTLDVDGRPLVLIGSLQSTLRIAGGSG